jgi:hypothetical protein
VEEEFVASTSAGEHFGGKDMGEGKTAGTPGDGGGGDATKEEGRDGEVEFVHQAGLEEGGVEFAAAFAEETTHAEFAPEPAEGIGQVHPGVAGVAE